MRLIVVRHGETPFNRKGLLNGRVNENLTAKGKSQAQDLVKLLDGFSIDCIYSSPFKRAMQTATPIAEKLDLAVNQDERLLEVDHGDFTGKPYSSTVSYFGMNSVDYINTYKYDFGPYNGESWRQTKARVQAFVDDIKKTDYKTVLIVTHGGALRWFYYICKKQKVGLLPNSGLHIFEV